MASPPPLTRDRILAAAEDVIRRFGPAKATVVDVARALGVSHAAVYKHVATKAELRDLVIERWMDVMMPPVRAIAAAPGPAPERLRQLFDTLIAMKRRRAAEDPELFAAYRILQLGGRVLEQPFGFLRIGVGVFPCLDSDCLPGSLGFFEAFLGRLHGDRQRFLRQLNGLGGLFFPACRILQL